MTIIPAFPFTLTNGTLADASQVMANFNNILNSTNANGAHNGPNSDITSLSGMTTPLSVGQGGTGQSALGNTGQVLTSTGGASVWQTGATGIVDGSAAPAGQVGEYQTATGASSPLTNGVSISVVSLNLSPGDWNVWGEVNLAVSTVALTALLVGLSTVSGSLGTSTGISLNAASIVTGTALSALPFRLNITSATLVYLTVQGNFTGGSASVSSAIYARRVR